MQTCKSEDESKVCGGPGCTEKACVEIRFLGKEQDLSAYFCISHLFKAVEIIQGTIDSLIFSESEV